MNKHGAKPRGHNNVDWTKYYEAIESHAPDIKKGRDLVREKKQLIGDFKKN